MPPPPHTKPENVLKVSCQRLYEDVPQQQANTPSLTQRAQELIAVDQSPAALTILHEHVTSKRSRNSPITSLEPVMIQFVELCVDLKKGKLAKDGLYQYKNTAQNTNVGTIEVRRFEGSLAAISPANQPSSLFLRSLSSLQRQRSLKLKRKQIKSSRHLSLLRPGQMSRILKP